MRRYQREVAVDAAPPGAHETEDQRQRILRDGNLYLPLNRRLELLLVAPCIASNTTSPAGHFVGNLGDLMISERFRLVEQRNFSMQAFFDGKDTGQTVDGNDINYITTALEFWCNFAPRWVVRGETGINIDTGRKSATDT
jgi:hypothetical protein